MRGHGVDQRVHIARAGGQADAGIHQFLVISGEQVFQLRGGCALIGPEQKFNACPVVFLGQLIAIICKNLAFRIAVHRIVLPGIADCFECLAGLSDGFPAFRQRNLASTGYRA